jgi:hypothetical protein
MSTQRSYRATALLGAVVAAVVGAVFLFGEPTANAPGTRPAAPVAAPDEPPAQAPAPASPAPAAPAGSGMPATDATPAADDPFAGVDVQLARIGAAPEPERLPPEATVRIGDRLRIGISSDRELHLYAFNQVEGAAATVMFPLAVLDAKNPLPPGEHELPGTVQGAHQSYTVEAAAPSEEVLLVLSETPVPALESRIARLAALGGTGGGGDTDLDAIAAEAGDGTSIHRWRLRHAP